MLNCLEYIHCIAHSLHLLLTVDMKHAEKFEDIESVIKLIKRTHGKLAYKGAELKIHYEEIMRQDVLSYLAE